MAVGGASRPETTCEGVRPLITLLGSGHCGPGPADVPRKPAVSTLAES